MAGAGTAVLAAAMLAGCGTVGTTGSGPAGSGPGGSGTPGAVAGPLCADPGAVTAVRVIRTPSLSELDPAKPGTPRIFRITITDPAKASGLARAVCGLPAIPAGLFHCPAEFAGGYQLTFLAGSRRFPVVTVQASGCERVTGAGRTAKWVARTPAFWTVLAQATGIRNPRHVP